MSRWRDLADRLPGKAAPGARRSSQWRKVRNKFLLGRKCAVCRGRKKLVAHHIIPFHLAPDLELKVDNLIALCEAKKYGINCHLLLGHVGRYQYFNANCLADVSYWHTKIKNS